MSRRFWQMGMLRLMLLGLTLLFVLLMPFAFAGVAPKGWDMLLGGFVPASAPLLVFVLLFDALMSHALRNDGDEEQRLQLLFTLRMELTAAGLLALSWLARFLPLLLP